MAHPSASTVTASTPPSTDDVLTLAVKRLERHLPPGTDSELVAAFLEDDLREGLAAAAEVQAHFEALVDALTEERLSPIGLLNASDDFRVLSRLEYLVVIVAQLRRRLSQVALKLTAPVTR